MLTRRSSDWTSTLPVKLSSLHTRVVLISLLCPREGGLFLPSPVVFLNSPCTAFGAIFPTVLCTVLLSCLKPSLCSDRAVGLSIVCPISLCHGRYTSHAHCKAGGCMHHDHFHTRCHFMSRPCSHTQLYCIISLGHTLGLTLEPQAQEHTCYHTVSFSHFCVSDSHDIMPARHPSLTSEPHTTCLLSVPHNRVTHSLSTQYPMITITHLVSHVMGPMSHTL